MANELHVATTSGLSIYATVRLQSGQIWNGSSWESYSSGNYSSYVTSVPEQGSSGYYIGSIPPIGPAMLFVAFYSQLGGSPAEGDSLVAMREYCWDGISVRSVLDVLSLLPSSLVGGRMDCSVGGMVDDVITSGALAASAVTKLQSGLATEVMVATLASQGSVDTVAGVVSTLASQGSVDDIGDAVAGIVASLAAGVDANLVTVEGSATLLGSVSLMQALNLIFAAAGGGKTDGAGTGSYTIYGPGDVSLVVIANDGIGNRTGVSLT